MKREKGIILLMMLAMISSLAIVIMICAFVLSHEVNKDERHDITRQRMLEVKRALIGRLADVSGGEDIISCDGFISDFGEPIDTPVNFIDRLLNEQDPAVGPDIWVDWHYDSQPLPEFWAGYRVAAPNDGCYLKVPPAQPNPTNEFLDGWGFPIEVVFVGGVGGNTIDIISRGSDGQPNAVNPGSYDEDIINTFYWKRPQVDVSVKNTVAAGANLNVELIYPQRGNVQSELQNYNFLAGETHIFSFTNGGNGIPVGLRKVVIRDAGAGNVVKIIRMLCLTSGSGTYIMEQIEYSG